MHLALNAKMIFVDPIARNRMKAAIAMASVEADSSSVFMCHVQRHSIETAANEIGLGDLKQAAAEASTATVGSHAEGMDEGTLAAIRQRRVSMAEQQNEDLADEAAGLIRSDPQGCFAAFGALVGASVNAPEMDVSAFPFQGGQVCGAKLADLDLS
jgi:hypothetical protein